MIRGQVIAKLHFIQLNISQVTVELSNTGSLSNEDYATVTGFIPLLLLNLGPIRRFRSLVAT